jgi:hypothetical protein
MFAVFSSLKIRSEIMMGASEVKSLANQTAKATDEIGTQIAQVQSATVAFVAL